MSHSSVSFVYRCQIHNEWRLIITCEKKNVIFILSLVIKELAHAWCILCGVSVMRSCNDYDIYALHRIRINTFIYSFHFQWETNNVSSVVTSFLKHISAVLFVDNWTYNVNEWCLITLSMDICTFKIHNHCNISWNLFSGFLWNFIAFVSLPSFIFVPHAWTELCTYYIPDKIPIICCLKVSDSQHFPREI